jgi:crotonobetainyl-CoA:carnitine CoA-transferase CaiB-like acyl-CoA transferase
MMGSVAGQERYHVDDAGTVTTSLSDGLYFSGSIDGPLSTALYAALTAVAALQQRDRTGEGAYIDAAGADAVLASQCLDAVMAWNADRITDRRNPPPTVGLDPRRRPKYTWYQTKDDKIVLLAAIEHKFWDNFCRAVSRPDLLDVKDTTFAVDFADGGRADLFDQLVPIFRERTQAEWGDARRVHDIPLCPGNSRLENPDRPPPAGAGDHQRVRAPGRRGRTRAPAGPPRSATSRSSCTGTRPHSASTPRRSWPASVIHRSG